jgi:hypothetical protein
MCAPAHSFPPSTPLHRRLGLCLSAWKQIGASPTLLKWLRHGVPVEWVGQPVQPFHARGIPASPDQINWWLHTEALRLMKQGSLFQYPPGVVPK